MQIEQCEVCGQQFVAGYGYSIAACWLVTGSAYVPAYMCDHTEHNPQSDPDAPQYSGQHWGCSPEHAMEALMKCLQEHMHVDNLKERHIKKHTREGKLIPRYSEEDKQWAEKRYQEKGENFHLLDFTL